MRAFIFAAGLGTRLKPFTENHPKALVPVGGVPMLQRVILKLKEAGITRRFYNEGDRQECMDEIEAFIQECRRERA